MLNKIRSWQRQLSDKVVARFPSLQLERRAEFFVRLFEKHLTPQSRILDIGGGWGFYAAPLEQRGHDVTVLDVVKPGFQKAPVVVYKPGAPIPFPDKSFDVSMLVTVLHHIPDPEKVLREAIRVTRKTIVVVEDVYRHPLGRFWTILRDMIYNFEFIGHPCQFRKRSEWRNLFRANGLKPLEDKEVYTWIAGLRILNGVFILKVE